MAQIWRRPIGYSGLSPGDSEKRIFHDGNSCSISIISLSYIIKLYQLSINLKIAIYLRKILPHFDNNFCVRIRFVYFKKHLLQRLGHGENVCRMKNSLLDTTDDKIHASHMKIDGTRRFGLLIIKFAFSI